jgi:hypothetical protein
LLDGNPPDDEVYAAVWPGAMVVCSSEFGIDRPSALDRRFIDVGAGRTVYLHAMHSVVDWFAFAVWESGGRLRRALSLSPDSGIIENIGDPLPFEEPFWAGDRPAIDPEDDDDDDEDPYPFVFHPLELGEEALGTLFGFVYEGPASVDTIDPRTSPSRHSRSSRASGDCSAVAAESHTRDSCLDAGAALARCRAAAVAIDEKQQCCFAWEAIARLRRTSTRSQDDVEPLVNPAVAELALVLRIAKRLT